MRDLSGGYVLDEGLARVREGLALVEPFLEAGGMARPGWEGGLIRPLVGWAAAGSPTPEPADPLWRALAAVQLAHGASLLHDDVIDGAAERRGRATVAAAQGVAAALVEGDHLLTTAYRLAASTGSLAWVELFVRAVERTVAGEKAQAASAGRVLTWTEYEHVVLGKSGELLGAALAAGAVLRRDGHASAAHALGCRLGLVYQMLDDLLDYCPHVHTGKPALADYRRDLWTWPRLVANLPAGLDAADVTGRLSTPDPHGASPLRQCLRRLRVEAGAVAAEAAARFPGDRIIPALLASWVARAEAAIGEAPADLPPVGGWEGVMAERARSFRFAARLFPPAHREQVAGVYAWCRYTDDLVDGVDLPPGVLEARLDTWLELSSRAYRGEATGNDLADRVMGQMRQAGVPLRYASELIEGMRMDVRGVRYATLGELSAYTYRVASVVGLWVTTLFGIRDPWMLERAATLGHAMQLTNILRDVGEDLDAGRVYLPESWLRAHGLAVADLRHMRASGTIDPRYARLVEALLRVAEAEYDAATPAIDRLPDFYRRPVAVAADVYRGIHDAIRANGYDNLARRAHTTLWAKLRLGTGALLRSRKRRAHGHTSLPRAAALALTAVLLAAVPAAAQGAERGLEEIGRLWVEAVDTRAAVDAGLLAVERIRRASPLSNADRRLLTAYEGSLTALRAKHGGWPPDRLKNLRRGFELLDGVVAEDPDAPELRYVRLMSGFYLPSIFGRTEAVEEDLAALVRLLPEAPQAFPPKVLPEVVGFLLEHASPDPAERARLEALLR